MQGLQLSEFVIGAV